MLRSAARTVCCYTLRASRIPVIYARPKKIYWPLSERTCSHFELKMTTKERLIVWRRWQGSPSDVYDFTARVPRIKYVFRVRLLYKFNTQRLEKSTPTVGCTFDGQVEGKKWTADASESYLCHLISLVSLPLLIPLRPSLLCGWYRS